MGALLILGASSLCESVVAVVQATGRYEIVGALDDNPDARLTAGPINILGKIDKLATIVKQFDEIEVVIAIGDPSLRAGVFEKVNNATPSLRLATVIHPSAVTMLGATLARGSIVLPGAVIGANVKVGMCGVINSNATIGTGSSLGDFVSVGPGSHIGSECRVGARTFVGIGAAIAQRTTIGCDCKIGALSFVSGSVPDASTAVGIPARW